MNQTHYTILKQVKSFFKYLTPHLKEMGNPDVYQIEFGSNENQVMKKKELKNPKFKPIDIPIYKVITNRQEEINAIVEKVQGKFIRPVKDAADYEYKYILVDKRKTTYNEKDLQADIEFVRQKLQNESFDYFEEKVSVPNEKKADSAKEEIAITSAFDMMALETRLLREKEKTKHEIQMLMKAREREIKGKFKSEILELKTELHRELESRKGGEQLKHYQDKINELQNHMQKREEQFLKEKTEFEQQMNHKMIYDREELKKHFYENIEAPLLKRIEVLETEREILLRLNPYDNMIPDFKSSISSFDRSQMYDLHSGYVQGLDATMRSVSEHNNADVKLGDEIASGIDGLEMITNERKINEAKKLVEIAKEQDLDARKAVEEYQFLHEKQFSSDRSKRVYERELQKYKERALETNLQLKQANIQYVAIQQEGCKNRRLSLTDFECY